MSTPGATVVRPTRPRPRARVPVKSAARRQTTIGKIAPRNLAIFTRQLSVMIDAGLPIVQCLELLAKEEPDAKLARAIDLVRADIEAGLSFAEALERRGEAFDPLYTNMVAAGEAGGILDVILARLSTYIEKQVKLRGQVRSAMMYPSVVLSIAAMVVVIILWKVVPTFTLLFKGLGASLPLPTRIVIGASNLLIYALPFLVAGALAITYLFRRYYRTPRGRLRVDRILLATPMIGKILRKVAVARFCRTLGTLMSSGVPLLDGLDITAKTSGNAVIEAAVRHVRSRIERGETIAAPLRATGVFPHMVSQMIGAGESTGALDTMLNKIAEFYEEEVDVAVAGLLTTLEPLMIAFLGIIVGGIVVSMYMPMFDLISQLSSH